MDESHLESVVLNLNESAVLRALTRRDADNPAPRMAMAYRKILELSRSDDAIDGVLVAHLVRDLLAASPQALVQLGIDLPRERLEYRDRVARLAETWPAEGRNSEPPEPTIIKLRGLLADHDAASERAGDLPRAVFAGREVGRPAYIPDRSVKQWRSLSGRASDLAHRVKAPQLGLPSADEIRRLVDELTATLLAAIAPFLTGIDEIDRFIGLEAPGAEEARSVADLIRTPAQEAYFFDRAGPQWLSPLAPTDVLASAPPLIDVGQGYVQAPGWPQGRFMAKSARSDPELVLRVVSTVRHGNNPNVVTGIIRIARALPADSATELAPQIATYMAVPLAVEYATVEAAGLVTDLASAGFGQEAATLLVAIAKAAADSERDAGWHLAQALGDPIKAVVGAGGDVANPLGALLKRLIHRRGVAGRYSTMWLHRIDQPPRHSPRKEWLVANAVYRVLLTEAIEAGVAHAGVLLGDGEPVLARVALAAIAERPDLLQASDALLTDPKRWDEPNSTRYEFRRALRSLWSGSSAGAHDALLTYAAVAEEAEEIIKRLAAADIQEYPTPEAVRQQWRSRLLYSIIECIPGEWSDRLGSLERIEDEGVPEPTAEWVRHVSPVSEEQLATMEPAAVLAAMRDFVPGQTHSLGEPSAEGLAAAAAAAISARVGEFRGCGQEIAALQPRFVSAVMSSLHRGLLEEQIGDATAAVKLALDVGGAHTPATGDAWSQQVRRDLAGAISLAASHEILTEAHGPTVLELLRSLLADPDPTPESEKRDSDGGYDVGMLALNSVRGEATTAGIKLLLQAVRSNWSSLAEEASVLLREHVAEDSSRSVRAAVGMRLPWLLATDELHQVEWLELLFGNDVTGIAMQATWEAYLVYSRYFSSSVVLLGSQYEVALTNLAPRPEENRVGPMDPDEMLGVHVAMAHIFALPAALTGRWLPRFYANGADWVRARVTRWIAEQAANADATPEVRERAVSYIRERIPHLQMPEDEGELTAVGWIGGTTDRAAHVLESIVLPTLERTGGVTQNEPGVADLIARSCGEAPIPAAQALRLLVRGDRWRSLPHVAGGDLRHALEILRTAVPAARSVAGETVNLLCEQGFLEYRDLLPSEV